ncbi:hypothetical protein ACHAXA_005285 [Cyclostephanos tholiformis]|uniref:EF-hand domain-containing protein n=1 Tax=Cyclostephanos tholiformis TaxID=382380 RepID=A0ABD3R8X0_9STRA
MNLRSPLPGAPPPGSRVGDEDACEGSGEVPGENFDSDAVATATEKLIGVCALSPEIVGNGDVAARDDDDGVAGVGRVEARGGDRTPSFSMTLAIGPDDTRRVFRASAAFNAEIRRIQRVEGWGVDHHLDRVGAGGGDASEERGEDEPSKRKAMDHPSSSTLLSDEKSKKKPAIVHSPPSREDPLRPPSGGDGAMEDSGAGSNSPPPAAYPRPLRNLLIPAAKNTNDPLIKSFLSRMEYQNISLAEQQTSLLFFLDADKSTKLLAAFDVLSNEGGTVTEIARSDAIAADTMYTVSDEETSKSVKRLGLIRLFQSFLNSISTCVHGGKEEGRVSEDKVGSRAPTPTVQNTSPENDPNEDCSGHRDWKGSGRTQREILDVATFAADNLIEYAKNEDCDASVEKKKEVVKEIGVMISFDVFGKWYNSGGFTHVPWLELLDLSKWDYTGSNFSANIDEKSSSSSKRARVQNIDPLTPSVSNMNEPIGSPTDFFASGAMLGATPQTTVKASDTPNHQSGHVQSFAAMFGEMEESRTVVSFDFSGSSPYNSNHTDGGSSFHIDITEENLVMLRNLVRRTGFASLTPHHVESLMMKHARVERHKNGEIIHVISRAQFGKFIREVVPKESSKNFDPTEIENFSNYFTNFFTCFDYSWSDLKKDEVNAKELMVGFTFLFAGNKSSKLAAAYEILDVDKVGYLTQRGLMQYLRSYLTMLAGISLLSASKKTTTQIRKRLMSPKRNDAFLAVQNGAKWTLSHFLRAFEQELNGQHRNSTRINAVKFEDFAKWYTEGGYAVAPWLELLDLQKFLSLIGESSAGKHPPDSNDESLSEVLFTFPLAKGRSLIVLRDDAHYVRSVVSELGLLSLTCEDIWSVLFNDIANIRATEGEECSGIKKSLHMEVDQMTFVHCMMRILNGTGKIKQNSSQWPDFSPEDTLKNFYLSFDLAETKRVPLNQLMCGLSLLCGGKKSNKLVFAFGLFCNDDISKNGKKKSSMVRIDFFYFFRSFLIVMFSCCNQSLSLSAEVVTQYISDTAKSVADDVVAYWHKRKVDKVKFENFSEWYNEGGFETAPWLELLDLNKWVLADQVPLQQQQHLQQQQTQEEHPVPPTPAAAMNPLESDGIGLTPGHEAIKALWATPNVKTNVSLPNTGDCPPAPDDDHLFDLDIVDAEEDAMASFTIDDLFLQQEAAAAHGENINYIDPAAAPNAEPQNALKFNLLTHDQFGGYIISIGQNQVQLLHRIVTKTGLYLIDAPTICKYILYDGKSRRQINLTNKSFQSAMKRVFDFTLKNSPVPVSSSTQEELSDFTERLFASFDMQKTGKISAVSLACGFAVLCGGRKSDKLEHVFELLDEDKDALVSKQDISRFIKSFLVMLMSVSSSFTHLYGGLCSNDGMAIARAIESGSEWATSQVFDALQPQTGTISFDDFADWYTRGGYQSMPWLELLDLRKWVLGES